jgi:type VI secretion system secreted protein Hcp
MRVPIPFRPVLMAASVALALCAGQAQAGFDYFLKLDDIKGSSTDDKHPNWNEIDTFNWGLGIETTSAGATSDITIRRPVFRDFEWTQALDASVAKLFERASLGGALDTVTLHATTDIEGRRATFFEMVFTDAFVTTFDLTGSSGSAPALSAALEYRTVTLKYITLKQSGAAGEEFVSSYDLSTRTGSADALAAVYAMGLSGPTVLMVPEPESWALLLAGLGLTGFAARRRARQRAGGASPAAQRPR